MHEKPKRIIEIAFNQNSVIFGANHRELQNRNLVASFVFIIVASLSINILIGSPK